MTDSNQGYQLPHHGLVAYRRAVELLKAVGDCQIRDARLREQALKAAKRLVSISPERLVVGVRRIGLASFRSRGASAVKPRRRWRSPRLRVTVQRRCLEKLRGWRASYSGF